MCWPGEENDWSAGFKEAVGGYEPGEVDRVKSSWVLLAPCGKLEFLHCEASRGL